MRRLQVSISLAALLIGLIAAALLPSRATGAATPAPAPAATWTTTVNSTLDEPDAVPGDGVCATIAATCTLRAAIMESNARPGTDLIILHPGTYTLTIPGANENAAAAGDLDVLDDLVIEGAGRTATIIDGAGLDRVIETPFNARSGIHWELHRLTIRNGAAFSVFNQRSALLVDDVSISGPFGGGIFNYAGPLEIRDSSLSSNRSIGEGAGIFNLTGDVTIVGTAITANESGGSGGGIWSEAGSIEIHNSLISGNTATRGGGGVYARNGALLIVQSTISENDARQDGGGIYNDNWFSLSGSVVRKNSAGSGGGGLYVVAVTVTDSEITENRAVTGEGGGVLNTGELQATRTLVALNEAGGNGGGIKSNGGISLVASTVRANYAGTAGWGSGGGVYSNDGIVSITNSTIEWNVANRAANCPSGQACARGGGIYQLRGTVTVSASTISRNSAGYDGGGIFSDTLSGRVSNVALLNSTLSGNSATGRGGAVYLDGTRGVGVLDIVHSTITANTASDTGGGLFLGAGSAADAFGAIIARNGVSDCSGTGTLISAHSLDADGTCGLHSVSDLSGVDPFLGPLANNGGPTQTHAPLAGSPVLDMISPATCRVAADQRGIARPQGPGCDVGAVESLSMDTTPPDTTITGGPPALTNTSNATFTFASSEAGTFQCSLDGGAFAACTSPADYSGLADGPHTFQVRAKDTAGNIDPTPASSTWTVDTIGPALTVPGNMTAEASSPSGAIVTYTTTANDAVDGAVAPVCTSASGSTFAIGSTTVTCTATDVAGNPSSAFFTVTVEDTTPPVLTLPTNIAADATGPSGAVATFTVTATDIVTPSPTVVCDPASGSTFAIGTTTVSCAATDTAGNTTTGAFSVHVNSASEQVQALADAIAGVGPGTSLSGKVQTLQEQIAAGDTTAACNTINKPLLNEVSAQTGKKLTLAQAAAITADANRIAAVLGC